MNTSKLIERRTRGERRMVLDGSVWLCAAAVSLIFGGWQSAKAATKIWDGNEPTASQNWGAKTSNDTNWDTGVPTPNGANDFLQFAGTLKTSPNMEVSYDISSIQFNSGASAFTLTNTGGTRLQVQAGIVNLDDNIQTINISAITIVASQTWNAGTVSGGSLVFGGSTVDLGSGKILTIAGSNNTSIANVIGGSGSGITKIDSGTFTLSGANTYTGVTTLTGGTLSVATIGNGGVAGNLGQATTAAANLVFNGGTLRYTGATAGTDRNFTIDAATTATFDVTTINNNLTVSGGSTATSGALTKIGVGTLTLSGANGYTGVTTISAGVLNLARGTADNSAVPTDGLAGNTDITISGGTLRISASEQIGNSAGILLNSGTFEFSGSGRTETIGAFTNAGGTFTTGTGTGNLLLGTGNTINWNSGTNTITSGNTVSDTNWNIRGGTNTVNGNGILQVQSGGTGLNFTGTGTPVVTLDSSASTAGKILLQGNVTVDSTITGKAQILSGGALANSGFIDMNGGSRTFTVANAISGTDLEIGASIQNGGVTKVGAGTMTLTGNNTFSGATTISASGGTLEAAAAGALGSTSGITVNTGGTLLLSGSGDRINDSATMTLAGGTFNTGGLIETLGVLTLSTSSVIDMGTGASILHFADSSAQPWAGTLSIWNWSGNGNIGGGTDQLFFGSSSSGLTAAQLTQIKFYSDAGTTILPFAPGFSAFTGGFGEVVPVPEASSVALAMGVLGLIGWRERRRMQDARKVERLAIA